MCKCLFKISLVGVRECGIVPLSWAAPSQRARQSKALSFWANNVHPHQSSLSSSSAFSDSCITDCSVESGSFQCEDKSEEQQSNPITSIKATHKHQSTTQTFSKHQKEPARLQKRPLSTPERQAAAAAANEHLKLRYRNRFTGPVLTGFGISGVKRSGKRSGSLRLPASKQSQVRDPQ
jgi:hypothetical protein